MKFKSRRDLFFTIMGVALIIFLSGTAILAYLEIPDKLPSSELPDSYVPVIIVLVANILIISMFFFTSYELTGGYLKYRSGIIYGKIRISRIREIIVGKTMRVGLKPATASKGLIIKYDKYEDLYISPDSNESFVKAILNIKSDIIITEQPHN